ncbi:hypothetical protein ACXHQL_17440 [Vibrio parahaemolyticus]|uniref:hypothetical protein n=1 Tax=Vibrio parahaemolyticus TaxID=670 RepID=UPI001D16D9BC|nr:hypothetical protein [Vibrio parahaemolyticus]MCC3798374.1 hypothetical protein [Vibrio parahaemolyticus]MCC3813172.1 hypothetical protein [Vibrio parahaemolyticus]
MNIVRDDNGVALLDNPETVYFESSVGEGKAKYWTDDLNKAHVFTDMESAVSMLLQTNRKHYPVSIQQLREL